jgi:hypothetical protein
VQIHSARSRLENFGPSSERPVIQALADHIAGELIGSRLQLRDIVDGQERVVVFADTNSVPVQFLFDEGVAVEVLGALEREE